MDSPQEGHFKSPTVPSDIKIEKYSSRHIWQKIWSHDNFKQAQPDLFSRHTSHFTIFRLNSSRFSWLSNSISTGIILRAVLYDDMRRFPFFNNIFRFLLNFSKFTPFSRSRRSKAASFTVDIQLKSTSESSSNSSCKWFSKVTSWSMSNQAHDKLNFGGNFIG